jgi:hypothetical protein
VDLPHRTFLMIHTIVSLPTTYYYYYELWSSWRKRDHHDSLDFVFTWQPHAICLKISIFLFLCTNSFTIVRNNFTILHCSRIRLILYLPKIWYTCTRGEGAHNVSLGTKSRFSTNTDAQYAMSVGAFKIDLAIGELEGVCKNGAHQALKYHSSPTTKLAGFS